MADYLEALSCLKSHDLDRCRLVADDLPIHYLTLIPSADLLTDNRPQTFLERNELRVQTSFGEFHVGLRTPAVVSGCLENVLLRLGAPAPVTLLRDGTAAFVSPIGVIFARLDGRVVPEAEIRYEKYWRSASNFFRAPSADYYEYRFDARRGVAEVRFYDLERRIAVTVSLNFNGKSATFSESAIDETTLRELRSRLKRVSEVQDAVLVRTPDGTEVVWVEFGVSGPLRGSHLATALNILNTMREITDSPLAFIPALLGPVAGLYATINGLSVEIRCRHPAGRMYNDAAVILPVTAFRDLLFPLVSVVIFKTAIERLRPLGPFGLFVAPVIAAAWEWAAERAFGAVLDRWYSRTTLAPFVEEPFKRLVAIELGVPGTVSGLAYGLLEGLWKSRTLWGRKDVISLLRYIALNYVFVHALLTVLPLPIAMEVHYHLNASWFPEPEKIHLLVIQIFRDLLTGDIRTMLSMSYYTILSLMLESTFGIPIMMKM
ncbi:hypothetical protein [Methanopyrus kandleri]